MIRGKPAPWHRGSIVEVKSKFGAEFRRFSLNRCEPGPFTDFRQFLLNLHHVEHAEIYISYADLHGDLLPINNDDNFWKAASTERTLLRIIVQQQEEIDQTRRRSHLVSKRIKSTMVVCGHTSHTGHVQIGMPQNFRPVSSIIDVDILPECHRRVRLHHHGSDRPLGFYIRDGTTVSVTPHGLQKVPGIFISRIIPGGLADSCGLLAINDQVLEVNGIEVMGKSLDQVTDMMLANSHNLIITVKPANQCNNVKNPDLDAKPLTVSSDGAHSVSYPGLPMIIGSSFWKHNDRMGRKASDVVVDKTLKNLFQSFVTTAGFTHQHRLHLSSLGSYRSQPCLSQMVFAGLSMPLQRDISSQEHYKSSPSFRQSTYGGLDILSTLNPDLRRRLLVPSTEMEEDGTVLVL